MLKTTLFVVLAFTLTNATQFIIKSNCPGSITVHSDTSSGTSPVSPGGLTLAQGQSVPLEANGWIGNIYANTHPASLAEFALNQWGGLDFYDISLIVGFNLGMQIAPSGGCQVVTCTGTPCPDAYMTPTDDWATKSCAVGASYQITFCP